MPLISCAPTLSSVDCAGGGGGFCDFKVHHGQNGTVKLESLKTGKWVAVKDGGVHVGVGGPHCNLKFFR